MCLRAIPGGVAITLHAQPGAQRSEVVGVHGEALKIRIAARPVEGAANAELIRFLSERLDVRRKDISLVRGATSRAKLIEIVGLSEAAARAKLGL